MASDQQFVSFVCEQMSKAGDISYRKMFGEYAIYRDEKVVAFVCDNQLFVKPTVAGKSLLGRPIEAPPYPGAKPYFLIADGLDDGDSLCELVIATCRELPAPRPKTKPKPKAKAKAKAKAKQPAKKK
jgi:TfoX/Sxy family transcriptional regulator of competence genes